MSLEISKQHQDDDIYPPGFNSQGVVPYTLYSQHVSIDIDFVKRTVKGESKLMLLLLNNDEDEIEIDARYCQIDLDNITVGGFKALATYNDPHSELGENITRHLGVEQHHILQDRLENRRQKYATDAPKSLPVPCGCQPTYKSLKIQVPPEDRCRRLGDHGAAKSSSEALDASLIEIKVPFYVTDPTDGYHFGGLYSLTNLYPHLYTRHSPHPGMACALFPTIDDSCSTAAWKITISFPKTLGLAVGQPAGVNASTEDEDSDTEYVYPHELDEAQKMMEMTAVASGYLTDESSTDTHKSMTFDINLDHSSPASLVGFAVGPFVHVDLWSGVRTEEEEEKTAGQGLKVHGYCLPGREIEVQNLCRHLAQAADVLVVAVGRYSHWDYSFKICFVDDMVDDTAPLLSFAICSSRLLFRDNIIDPEYAVLRELITCVAWQFSGACLVPDYPSDSWVVYGLAGYLTELVMTAFCGVNFHKYHVKMQAERLIEMDVGMPPLDTLGSNLHLGSQYVEFMKLKSFMVMSMLDARLAKKTTSKGLVRVIGRMFIKANGRGNERYDAIMARSVTSENFRERCEKFSDLALKSFWREWVCGSGSVAFEVIQRFNKKRLSVELLLRQVQDRATERKLDWPSPSVSQQSVTSDNFWSKLQVKSCGVSGGDVCNMFTGPITIKIHEADGTPYEHTVEIVDDTSKVSRFEIPYNTKYRRIKRNRRQRERLASAHHLDVNGVNGDATGDQRVIYMFGDVLQSKADMEAWGLRDWDETQERQMDNESYEWLRFDADSEWVCRSITNMPVYMYVSQLQQDYEVVAQQESLAYLGDCPPSPLVATFLIRTLMDKRYFWGLRMMAASLLTRQNGGHMDLLGAHMLTKAFEELFCDPQTRTVCPNNFQDKQQYFIRGAIIRALSRVRDAKGVCPHSIPQFLLHQLSFNDNTRNYFSDTYYVSAMIEALTTSLIPGDPDRPAVKPWLPPDRLPGGMTIEAHEARQRQQALVAKSLEEIERYQRMDEWNPSYRKMGTIAWLEANQRLMRAGLIKPSAKLFLTYTTDEMELHIQVKAHECISRLGFLFHKSFWPYFRFCYCTNRSPYMREELFKVLCIALAGIGLGEEDAPSDSDAEINQTPNATSYDTTGASAGQMTQIAGKGVDADVDDEEAALVVVQADAVQKQMESQRQDISIDGVVETLKRKTCNNTLMQEYMWDLFSAEVLSLEEKTRLLSLYHHLFDIDYSLVVELKCPRKWSFIGKNLLVSQARKKHGLKKSLVVTFKLSFEMPYSPSPAAPTATPSTPVVSRGPPPIRSVPTIIVKTQPAKRTPLPNSAAPGNGPRPKVQPANMVLLPSSSNSFSLRPGNPQPHGGAPSSPSVSSSPAKPLPLRLPVTKASKRPKPPQPLNSGSVPHYSAEADMKISRKRALTEDGTPARKRARKQRIVTVRFTRFHEIQGFDASRHAP